MQKTPKPKLIIFDVNETLVDLGPVKEAVNAFYGKEDAATLWFGKLLHYSLVDRVTGQYHNFSEIADAVMDMVSAYYGREMPGSEKKEILSKMAELPAHEDVKEGLRQLKEAGFRLATFTNSAQKVADKQLVHAGIDHFFERSLSVESLQLYKPELATYKKALQRLETEPGQTLFVAAHGWDMAGSAQAGLQTAFIQRKGKSLYPLAPSPNYTASTISDLARQLGA
jgi:2-haloacid dehalogenase